MLDTPDAGVNAAFGWAVGQRPGSVRAEAGPGLPEWDATDLDHLRMEGRAFRRVGPAAISDPGAFIREVITGLFGAGVGQAGGRFALAPWIVPEWRTMALRRLRLHRTMVDVEVRPRAEWVTLRVAVRFGPAIPVALSLRNTGVVGRVTVDEVPLEAARAVFSLAAEHEVMFFFTGAAA